MPVGVVEYAKRDLVGIDAKVDICGRRAGVVLAPFRRGVSAGRQQACINASHHQLPCTIARGPAEEIDELEALIVGGRLSAATTGGAATAGY